MAIHQTGPIAVSHIAAEFGGAIPHYLGEYYGVSTGVPTSGLIQVGDFYGKAVVERYVFGVGYSYANGVSQDGYYSGGRLGWVSPGEHWRGRHILSMVYWREGGKMHFTLNGTLPQNYFSRLVTEDGWTLWATGTNTFVHVNGGTEWAWQTPLGGWDGTVPGRTRWVDIYP